MSSRFVVSIVRVDFEEKSRRARGEALRRYAGRLIEIGRNTRTVMVLAV
jgi:hypothetical protein